VTPQPARLRRADVPSMPPGVLLRVRRGLLPLYWWRDVPVLTNVRHELTVFERYLLEMALTLGRMTSADVEEVLGLPPELLDRGAWRLTAAGALRRDADGYHVVAEQARSMLDARTLPQLVESAADFVLLPRTGDLLVLAPGRGGWLAEAERQRRKLRPRHTAPAPPGLWPRRRAEYLAERVRAGQVAGPDRDIAEVLVPESGDEPLLPPVPLGSRSAQALAAGSAGSAEAAGSAGSDGSVVPRGCPAYHCSAEVRQDASGIQVEVKLSAAPPPGQARNRDAGDDPDPDDPAGDDDGPEDQDDAGAGHPRSDRDDHFTLTVDLTGAEALVAGWRALLDTLDDGPVLRAAWQQVITADCDYLRAERTSVSSWVFYLSGEAAEEVARSGQSLVDPAGLEVEDDETTLEVHVSLAPGDDLAHVWFARDLAIASLLAEADPVARVVPVFSAALAELEGRAPRASQAARTLFTETAVRERIWQLRRFRLAYALREQKDFAYE
jgi:hypothetical protein